MSFPTVSRVLWQASNGACNGVIDIPDLVKIDLRAIPVSVLREVVKYGQHDDSCTKEKIRPTQEEDKLILLIYRHKPIKTITTESAVFVTHAWGMNTGVCNEAVSLSCVLVTSIT